MRTVTFKSVLYGVARKMGLEPEVNFQSNQAAAFTQYINERIRESVESYDWPEFIKIEERAYRNAYSASTTYAVGAEVYYATTAKYYTCILISLNHAPTDTTYWTELTSFVPYVALQQTGKTIIGECMACYERDPRLTLAPGEVDFVLREEGIVITESDAPATVFVQFRIPPPEYTSSAWAAGVYAVGDLVYYSTTGDVYKCIQVTTNQAPTDTTYWTKVDFPYVLSSYVTQAAYADALDEDGQQEKAVAAENRAEKLLVREYDKLEMQQQQRRTYKVRTS